MSAITLVPDVLKAHLSLQSHCAEQRWGTVTVTPTDNGDAIATYQYKSGTGALGIRGNTGSNLAAGWS